MPKSLDFHERIYKAIFDKDGEKAYSVMLGHINDVTEEFGKITEGD